MLENFKNECKNDAYNNRLGKVVYDDIKEITHNDNLASLELTEDCYVNGNIIGTTNTKSIKINTIGKPNVFNGELENGSIDKDGQNGTSPELDTTTYIELKEKLNSINDIADELDVVSGKGIKRIGEYICTGDEDIQFESNPDSNYIRARFPMDNVSKDGKRQPIISNYFKYALTIHDVGTGFISLGYFYFYLPKEYTTKEQYTQWLKDRYNEGNPLKIEYVLETPQEFTTEPINIQLRKGYNKIEIKDKNGLLNKTKLSYLADTEKTVDGTNSIIIEDAEPVNVRSLVVYGNSFQNTRSGKNLYNYTDTTTVTSGVTADEDGWITITGDNTGLYYNYMTNDLDLKENTPYLIVLEVKEVLGTGYLHLVNHQTNAGQFYNSMGFDFTELKSGDIKSKILNTKDDFSGLTLQRGLRTFASFDEAGKSGSITFRISVLEDTSITPEQFIYEPYGAMPSPEFPSEIKCVEGLENIFDKDGALQGWLISPTTGNLAHNGPYFTSDYIPVKPNTKYTFTNILNYYLVCFDKDKNYIGYMERSNTSTTLPGAAFIRTSGQNNNIDLAQIVEGSTQLPYLPYGKSFLQLVDTGKNLFSGWIKGIAFDGNGRQISSTKGAGTDYILIDFNINQNYTISNITENLALRFYAYNKSKEFIGMSSPNYVNELSFNHDIIGLTSGHTFGEIAYMRFELFQSASVSGNIDEVDNLLTQLEPGDQTTDFEPYIPNKVRNTEKFAIEKTTYTIDLTGATDVYLFFYDENDNLISKSGYHKLPYTFNNTDAKYVRFMFKDVNNDNLDVNDISDIQINDKFSLYGKDVDVNVGVKYDDDSEEYIELGKYTIDKPNDEETVNLGEYKGYDYLDKLNDNYVCTIEDFTSATVSDVLQDLCNQCGLEIDNLEFENNDFPVNGNIFENYKCKDVLSDILELACSIGIISKDSNKLIFRKLSKDSSVTLTKNDYSLLTKNQIYGPVNSFSIKESQIEGENVTIQDDESIKNNGETEFSIVDNIFLYTPELRQLVLDSIWNNIKGLTYYDCKIESYHGLPYLNAGDKITVEDDNGNYFDTYVLKHTFTYDGTFKSVIESPALTKQQTNIKSDVSLREKLNQTVINVYKDKKIIDALITENTEQGSKITQLELNTDDITARMEQNETSIQNTNDNLEHNYYQRTQVEEMVLNSASGVTNTFSEAGGNNILRNTDFSAKEVLEEGQEYEYWYGSAERLINSESANGYSIKIKKSNFYQEQNVANGNYTLSFYYKITNSLANVKVQINGQEYVLDSTYFTLFQTGIKNEDGTYKIEPINISDNHLKIEFITDIDDSIEIYDIMCNAGSVKLAYSQNANETRTDTVNIGKGITITSSTSDTKFVATPEIMGFKSVNGDKMITEFTNKGMTTKEAVVEDEAEIVGIIRQKVGNQIWDAVTGV